MNKKLKLKFCKQRKIKVHRKYLESKHELFFLSVQQNLILQYYDMVTWTPGKPVAVQFEGHSFADAGDHVITRDHVNMWL